ncbi:hypothetical protein [Flavobacterium cerinum]|uniref:Uncharacterized protein n=1 Tax=Flavobacterium cerinum TaxID=2502784 RepID=A0A444GMD5_9FLAO|nr:hypothetical protein [Flavobacterium cerinum]RWW92186.1 hypothetical protein EPI11_16305 [Flavobacterium cerinum]
MNRYIILLLVVVGFSCKRNEELIVPKVENATVPSKVNLFETESKQGKVLILSDRLPLYDRDSKESGLSTRLYGLIVDMDSISKNRIDIAKSDDQCKAFHFVKVNNPKVKGWLNSKDIYEYGNNERDTLFKEGDTDFKMYIGKNFGIGVEDEYGLSGCDNTSPVVLFNSKSNVEAYVPLKDKTGKYQGKFLVLDAHDGWYDKIIKSDFTGGKLKLIIHRSYQEGSADFTVIISLLDKGYSAEVIEFIEYNPEM